jgi:tetratricopeptide (TPR) repeat protein
MSSSDDLGNIIEQAEAARFVGRASEIENFRQHINRTPPSFIFYYIAGQGGVGKTTLLNRFKSIAKNEFGMLVAGCDEQQRTIPAVLGRFAEQFSRQNIQLKRFNERYKLFRQKAHEIEGDPSAPPGLAALLGKTIAHGVFTLGDGVPVLRKGLEMLPQDALEAQAGEWTGYLAKKLSSKDDVALVRDPAAILTPLLFDDLNAHSQRQKALLCFENFEAAQQELQQWLIRLVQDYIVSPNIRFAIAGREKPGQQWQWEALRDVTMLIPLDVLSVPEAEQFLNVYGVTDHQRRAEILASSRRLPVIMSWLAAPGGNQVDTSVPAHSIVDHFLRWVDNPMLREVALVGALPRAFNADILTLLLDQRYRNVNEAQAFDWLLTMPFVTERSDGWYYHDVVRRMMIYYQRQRSPRSYREKQAALANYYNASHEEEAGAANDMPWNNGQWRKHTLSYLYHLVLSNPSRYWLQAISIFAIAVRKWRVFALELLDMLNLDEVKSELSEEQNRDTQLFHQQLLAIEAGSILDGFAMFDRLCRMSDLDALARGHMLAYRAECYRLQGKWEEALGDFNAALALLPDDTRTLTRRGTTYLVLSRYDEALADLNRAIALNEKDAWAYAIRGEAYRRMGDHLDNALDDLDHAIELDEKHAWAFAMRGEMYRMLGENEEALKDFNHAIALDRNYTWAIQKRDEIQHELDNIPYIESRQATPASDEGLGYIDLSSVPMHPEPEIPQITTPLRQPDVPFYGTPVMPQQPEPPVPLITAPLKQPNIPTWKDPGQAIPYIPSSGALRAPQLEDTTHPSVKSRPSQPGPYPPIPLIPETPPLARRSGGVPLLLIVALVALVVLIALVALGFVFHIL